MTAVVNYAPSILVVIASYGVSQDRFLKRLLAEYGSFRARTRVVVLSNTHKKQADGATVMVGLPSPNPYSLPFAHRKVFAENLDRHDLFIYSEDDTLIAERQVDAFLKAQERLQDNEIAGFIRSETDPDGRCFITSIHHHFRWEPESIVERGGELFASLSNQHSGCFIATREHLRRAIESGGFLVPPHAERYGMLETAASDLYTQCGLRRLISLSHIEDFIVPHLPNKYYRHMGIPLEEVKMQTEALAALWRNGGWTGKLYEPCANARGFRGAKDLYERADQALLAAIPAGRVLSVGCGSGANELELVRRGYDVTVVPIDEVFGSVLRARGLRVVCGPFPRFLYALRQERFNTIVLDNVLHLVAEPAEWLKQLGSVLASDGQLVAAVANTREVCALIGDRRSGVASHFLHDISPARLTRWCRQAGLKRVAVEGKLDGSRHPARRWAAAAAPPLFASRFLLTASKA